MKCSTLSSKTYQWRKKEVVNGLTIKRNEAHGYNAVQIFISNHIARLNRSEAIQENSFHKITDHFYSSYKIGY